MSTTTKRLPDMIGWNRRPPTADECKLVGRPVIYSETTDANIRDYGYGDYVVETDSAPEAQASLAEAFEHFGMCDAAHVIPAGIYLEE